MQPVVTSTAQRRLPKSMASHPGFLLAKAHVLAHELAAESLAEHGLTIKHYGCLKVVADEGPISQQALGELMRVDRTTIVMLVDELERDAYVVRRRNPDDRRAYALEATPEGRAWLAAASRSVATGERKLLAPLDESERARLAELLRKLLGA